MPNHPPVVDLGEYHRQAEAERQASAGAEAFLAEFREFVKVQDTHDWVVVATFTPDDDSLAAIDGVLAERAAGNEVADPQMNLGPQNLLAIIGPGCARCRVTYVQAAGRRCVLGQQAVQEYLEEHGVDVNVPWFGQVIDVLVEEGVMERVPSDLDE